MKPLPLVVAAIVLAVFAFAPAVQAVDLNGSKKQEMERTLVGDWKVPKNKYKTTIAFSLTTGRTFTCQYQDPKKEAEDWSGHWRVRTASTGDVKAYLRARSQSDPEKYMRAVVRADPQMENFAIDIIFDFKGSDRWSWQSKFVRADAEDEAGEDEEGDDDWGDDEDTGGDDDWGDDEDTGGDDDWGDDDDWEEE